MDYLILEIIVYYYVLRLNEVLGILKIKKNVEYL